MRLIDVDVYCATICRCNRRECDKAKCPIHNAPTAYSVDKVVEELGQKKEEVQRMRNTCVALSDLEVCDIENVTYERAIEIVKQVGVSDDVCEWKKSKDYPFDWLVGCDGCEVNHRQGDYCPRCGKKIKVVE